MTTTPYGYKIEVSKETKLKIDTKVGVDMALYGYCRVSTKTQKLERQIDNITKAYGEDVVIYTEKYTGTKVDGRKEFLALMKKVKKGDTIVFDSVSRMSRNAEEGIELYFELYEKGINLIFLKEPYINTKMYEESISRSIDATGNEIADIYIEATNKVIRLLAIEQIKVAFKQAAKEVEDLQVRVSEGMKQAKKKNPELQIGQKQGARLNVSKKEPMKKQIRKLSKDFEGHNTDKEVMQITRLARNTYYKYKRELFQEIADGISS